MCIQWSSASNIWIIRASKGFLGRDHITKPWITSENSLDGLVKRIFLWVRVNETRAMQSTYIYAGLKKNSTTMYHTSLKYRTSIFPENIKCSTAIFTHFVFNVELTCLFWLLSKDLPKSFIPKYDVSRVCFVFLPFCLLWLEVEIRLKTGTKGV